MHASESTKSSVHASDSTSESTKSSMHTSESTHSSVHTTEVTATKSSVTSSSHTKSRIRDSGAYSQSSCDDCAREKFLNHSNVPSCCFFIAFLFSSEVHRSECT